ncbi:MAG: hypothetical protein AB8B71_19545 [Paracoccaceae bacterium]
MQRYATWAGRVLLALVLIAVLVGVWKRDDLQQRVSLPETNQHL